MENKRGNNNTNELLVFIYKHRKVFFFTGLIAGVGSIIISLLLPVLYQSTAIVFPTATSTVSFNAMSNAKSSSMDFGEEEQAQQLIQILKSGPLRNQIIKEFDLAKNYEIDTATKSFNYKLGQAYDDHISFNHTQYGSIMISVLDKQPKIAANIANRIVQLIDTAMNKVIKERTVPAFIINKRKLHQLEVEQKQLTTQIDSLAQLGVIGKESRAELYKSYNSAKSEMAKKYIQKQIDINKSFGAKYDALVELREFRTENISDQEVSYEQAESNAHENFIHKFVVQNATPSDRKAKPKRSIIVIVTTFVSLVFVLILLLIRDRFIQIKKEAGN